MNSAAWLKPTYRTRPEQAVGLSIFLSLSLLIYSLSAHWFAYHLFVPISIWLVWRRYSIFTLKLEIALFLTQLGFEILYLLSKDPLLSLFALLFLLCNTFLCILLYRKKEKLSQFFLLPALVWVLAITAWNMVFT
jgi:tryptophan-rich sensory protein